MLLCTFILYLFAKFFFRKERFIISKNQQYVVTEIIINIHNTRYSKMHDLFNGRSIDTSNCIMQMFNRASNTRINFVNHNI